MRENIQKKGVISSSLLAFKEGEKNWDKDILPLLTKARFRRAGKFANAAICGALECLKDFEQSDINLYFGSSNGDVKNTIDSQDSIFFEDEFPFPFAFINTLNNTPIFYLMQHLRLKSLGMSIASKEFAFEQCLSLALVDLNSGESKYALVGVCDLWFEPKTLSAKFLDERKYEFSAWLLLEKNRNSFVNFYSSFDLLIEKLKEFEKRCDFYICERIQQDERQKLQNYINIISSDAPETITNQGASIIAHHFNTKKQRPCFYIGKDERFGYSLVCLYTN